jgi:hypothetical protein
VAVDAQHVYWSNTGTDTIGEANLDGTGVNPSLVDVFDQASAVAVDAQHIYWTLNNANAIGEANLDGSDVNRQFIFAPDHPTGLAGDDQPIYWGGRQGIGVANVDGTAVDPTLLSATDTGGTVGGLALSGATAEVTPAAAPAFGTTAQATVGSPFTLTVTDAGLSALRVCGVGFSGADANDFFIGSDTCPPLLSPGQNCQRGLPASASPFARGAVSSPGATC